MQGDLAIGPAGDVWVTNNWQNIDSCFGVPAKRSQPGAVDKASRSPSGSQKQCVHHKSGRPERRKLSMRLVR